MSCIAGERPTIGITSPGGLRLFAPPLGFSQRAADNRHQFAQIEGLRQILRRRHARRL